jgi:hypothetical protein
MWNRKAAVLMVLFKAGIDTFGETFTPLQSTSFNPSHFPKAPNLSGAIKV